MNTDSINRTWDQGDLIARGLENAVDNVDWSHNKACVTDLYEAVFTDVTESIYDGSEAMLDVLVENLKNRYFMSPDTWRRCDMAGPVIAAVEAIATCIAAEVDYSVVNLLEEQFHVLSGEAIKFKSTDE